MKARGYLEEELPGTTIKWVRLANTAAIRETALAGDVDAGFLGIPPFLIALDQGMSWKLLCGLSRAPVGLVVPNGRWNTLGDLPSDAGIALPQPGSIQHILLGMALKKVRGDSSFLDHSLISLKHPDGMNALLSGSVDGHFTSPPYIFMESDSPGFEILLTGEEAMGGPYTFIAAMVTEDAYAKNPSFPGAMKRALEKTISYMADHPEETMILLSESYSLDAEILRDYLGRPGMVFETSLRGVDQFVSYMQEEGYLKNIHSPGEIYFQ
jgi:NitT/TauT family transport system substrate-binding protein